MDLRSLSTAVLAMLLSLLTTSSARAWSEAGHRIIASLAYRQLPPAAQARIATLLRAHPRYAEDFARHMPAEVAADAAAQNEWLFQQASIWPDMARGLPDELKRIYNHSTWHYIDIPSYLSEADRAAIEPMLSINQSLVAPAAAEPTMNAI